FVGAPACALILGLCAAHAQVAATAAPTADQLAKYDLNKNGVLDLAEQAALDADQKRAATAVASNNPATSTTSASEEVLSLSPFEVVSDAKGYYASNTMSGTRFNAKLEDLASSITVMTKEQMTDFGMLDINDVFLYTAGTEGTGTFTDYTI